MIAADLGMRGQSIVNEHLLDPHYKVRAFVTKRIQRSVENPFASGLMQKVSTIPIS